MSTASWLTQFVQKMLRRRPEQRAAEDQLSYSEVVEFGDFRMDIGGHTATVNGELLDLTAEEFDVLVFVINHPQRVVTPHTMLATSWSDRPRQTEFLRVLLSLRRKLDAAAPDKNYLRTEPRVVYRFNPAPPSVTRITTCST